jgi:hypothetical protein
MKKRILRFFSRLKLRIYIWSRKKDNNLFGYDDTPTPYEKTCFKICLKTIKHPNSNFMIAPVSDKRYIENKTMDLFITIDNGRVELTNHVYNYSVKLTNRDYARILYIFDNETEKRRLTYEDLVNSQIKNSLHNVLDRISKL